jgi:hypothetical protein
LAIGIDEARAVPRQRMGAQNRMRCGEDMRCGRWNVECMGYIGMRPNVIKLNEKNGRKSEGTRQLIKLS